MNLIFIQTAPTGGDCTAPYDVKLDQKCTFGELVKKILTMNEWGYIVYQYHCFEYSRDKCESIPEELIDRPVNKVKSSGGWGRMDYYIY